MLSVVVVDVQQTARKNTGGAKISRKLAEKVARKAIKKEAAAKTPKGSIRTAARKTVAQPGRRRAPAKRGTVALR